jgi:hypothetical protein
MSCLVGQELPRVSVPRGVEVRGKQFLVYGHCAACARSKRANLIQPSRLGASS